MELSADLWSRLPFNVVEQVLSLLPVPDLCRYCVVCKRWNLLISTPEFGALCAQNAAWQDASFIIIRYRRICDSPAASPAGSPRGIPVRSPAPSGKTPAVVPAGCCILDLNTLLWHVVEDDDQKYRHKLYSEIVGMDGGLVCQYSLTKRAGNSIIVYNPIAKTLKELPIAPDHFTATNYPELHMIVDNTSQSFKVFLINHNFNDGEFLADPDTSQEHRQPLVRCSLVVGAGHVPIGWHVETVPL